MEGLAPFLAGLFATLSIIGVGFIAFFIIDQDKGISDE